MSWIIKRVFLLLVVGGISLLQAASVEAKLSSNEIVKGNLAQLQIKAIGNRAAFPQIEKIGDAKVLGRSESSSMSVQIINSKKSVIKSTTLTLTFAPQHDMTIPPFHVNVDGKQLKTQPLSLRVVKSNASVPAGNGGHKPPFYLQIKSSKRSAIVGESILVTVYFGVRDGVRVTRDIGYQAPPFDGFLSKVVKDEKVYHKDGYRIQELRYILTPQKAGKYEIGPATARVGTPDRSRRDFFGNFGTRWSQIASNRLTLTIEPAPQESDLVGEFHASAIIDHTTTKANKPVNLTVILQGEGSLEDFEIPDYDIDGVSVYGDDPVVTSKVRGEKLYSTYKKHFVFIADHDFVIPDRDFSVLDPKSKTLSTLTIKGYSVKVTGGTTPTATPPAQSSSGTGATPLIHTNIPSTQSSEQSATQPVADTTVANKWMLGVAFVLGVVGTLLVTQLPWGRWLRKERFYKTDEALKVLYPHIDDDREVEAMVRKLYAKKRGEKGIEIDKKALKAMVERYR